MTEEEAENDVKNIVSGEWRLFDSASKELTEENCTLKKDSFFFERMANGVPVNFIYGILICHMMNYLVPG